MAAARSFDVAVVGAGAAGIAASLRVAAAGYEVALIERQIGIGGETASLAHLEALPGLGVGLTGAEGVRRAESALDRASVHVRTGARVVSVRRETDGWQLVLSDGESVRSRLVLAASGAGAELPDVPGSKQFSGAGVYTGVQPALSIGLRYDLVFVTGGVGAAARLALHVAPVCEQVVMVSSAAAIGAHLPPDTVRAIRASGNISARPAVEIVELVGVRALEAIVLRDVRSGRTLVRQAAALFVAGPRRPESGWLADSGAGRIDGLVATGCGRTGAIVAAAASVQPRRPRQTRTDAPGVFAAGAVRAGSEDGVAGAVADGVAAAREMIAELRRTTAWRSIGGE